MQTMNWRRWAAVVLLTPLIVSCKDIGDGEGGQCEPCRSSSPQCDSGMSCATFDGPFGKDHQLCAKPDTRSCPVS
ncbi:hypothetical protein HLB44_11890 [Aquincola sp. S2]|uniref:Uncharacterized protein n=1 Tax=Pseudaquabacterium terrae TaxID=2732868 RepID=A0ABX2EGG1_9BURK|nr:hypothetical protein [Aquabacterium terrae]NRF67687.1 hypothetical protein [Aquabacterium terrae]